MRVLTLDIEQPDTAAIRARRTLFGFGGRLIPDLDIEALCDALDAARAERDENERARVTAYDAYCSWMARAEAAEARAERLAETIAFERQANERNCSELLAAEARIAAALNIEPVMGKNLTPRDEFAWGYNTALGDFHRALTGDTE